MKQKSCRLAHHISNSESNKFASPAQFGAESRKRSNQVLRCQGRRGRRGGVKALLFDHEAVVTFDVLASKDEERIGQPHRNLLI